MELRAETQRFLNDLERSSNRKLHYPDEVGSYIERARANGRMKTLDEALFLAKFVTKTAGVMKRIGPDGEGYDKLSKEFAEGLQKIPSLLRLLEPVGEAASSRNSDERFFGLTHESMDRFMKLLADLTLVKNWVVDKKPLP